MYTLYLHMALTMVVILVFWGSITSVYARTSNNGHRSWNIFIYIYIYVGFVYLDLLIEMVHLLRVFVQNIIMFNYFIVSCLCSMLDYFYEFIAIRHHNIYIYTYIYIINYTHHIYVYINGIGICLRFTCFPKVPTSTWQKKILRRICL